MLNLLLLVYACFIPVYVVCFTQSFIASPCIAFLLFAALWGVNEVAKELENPFGSDINDISVADFHLRFIDVLFDTEVAHQARARVRDPVLPTSEKKLEASKDSVQHV